MSKSGQRRVLSVNRKARHRYRFLDTWDAGLVLLGSEVKSIRDGKVSWADAFASFERGELWLRNLHIGEYAQAGQFGHEPLRPRKCLLKKRELAVMQRRSEERGLTIVPVELFLNRGLIKVRLALGQGLKDYDKRDVIKSRDMDREVRRQLAERD